MALLLSALQVAAKSQAEVIVILSAGVVASELGLLTATELQKVAKLQLAVLQPCLIMHLNQSFTLARIVAWSPVILVAVVHMALGAAVGALAGRVLRITSPRRELLVLVCARSFAWNTLSLRAAGSH